MLPDFMQRYPELKVDLTLNDRFVDVVEEGYDVVLLIAWLPDSSLIARRLCAVRRVVFAAPGYWGRHGRPTAPAELADPACLHYAHLATANELPFRGPAGSLAVRVDGPLVANNGEVLKEAAMAGLGVALQIGRAPGGEKGWQYG